MTAPHTALSASDSAAVRRHPIRTVAAGIGATVVIAVGAYTTSHGAGAAPTTREHVSNERAMREMRMTIRALYGPEPRLERSRRRGV